jgi:ubiquinone/menaquinone biosynthesis C-methylase UbiE
LVPVIQRLGVPARIMRPRAQKTPLQCQKRLQHGSFIVYNTAAFSSVTSASLSHPDWVGAFSRLLLNLFIALSLIFLGALFLYWLFFLTEGAYLGERVVIWLYDLYAKRYDAIKNWDIEDEVVYLAQPFVLQVEAKREPPLILDVATGSGRLPLAVQLGGLLPEARWVLLDASLKMLQQARARLQPGAHLHFVQHSAQQLPFEDAFFDVVTCLEALEFFPNPEAALVELVRVLRPGGLLFITNRIGLQSRFLPGRTWSHSQVFQLLKALSMKNISIRPFLVDYEWVTAIKEGSFASPGRAALPGIASQLRAMDVFSSPDKAGYNSNDG